MMRRMPPQQAPRLKRGASVQCESVSSVDSDSTTHTPPTPTSTTSARQRRHDPYRQYPATDVDKHATPSGAQLPPSLHDTAQQHLLPLDVRSPALSSPTCAAQRGSQDDHAGFGSDESYIDSGVITPEMNVSYDGTPWAGDQPPLSPQQHVQAPSHRHPHQHQRSPTRPAPSASFSSRRLSWTPPRRPPSTPATVPQTREGAIAQLRSAVHTAFDDQQCAGGSIARGEFATLHSVSCLRLKTTVESLVPQETWSLVAAPLAAGGYGGTFHEFARDYCSMLSYNVTERECTVVGPAIRQHERRLFFVKDHAQWEGCEDATQRAAAVDATFLTKAFTAYRRSVLHVLAHHAASCRPGQILRDNAVHVLRHEELLEPHPMACYHGRRGVMQLIDTTLRTLREAQQRFSRAMGGEFAMPVESLIEQSSFIVWASRCR